MPPPPDLGKRLKAQHLADKRDAALKAAKDSVPSVYAKITLPKKKDPLEEAFSEAKWQVRDAAAVIKQHARNIKKAREARIAKKKKRATVKGSKKQVQTTSRRNIPKK